MRTKRIVYKNNLDNGGGSCTSESDLAKYLDSFIQKFNHRFDKRIGFFDQEILEGECLKAAISILKDELIDLLDNYHLDADPNGFGRSAMKIEVLGKERILNHFGCKIDQIIYSLNGLIIFLSDTFEQGGQLKIFGLGDIDVLDCNLIWEAKKILKSKSQCTFKDLKTSVEYIFNVDNIIDREPDIFSQKLQKLEKDGYLMINENLINVTEKGMVVDVWTNFIVKSVAIDKEKLKRFANRRL